MAYVISDDCIACGTCIDECPVEAISEGDRNINNADDLAMYLLEVGHVACVGGTSFGSPECIRMSYATSDENIIEAMRRIKEALALLK